MRQTHCWNLNEKKGYVFGTGLTNPDIRLELGFKRLNGTIEDLGNYELDLVALSDRGIVNRRRTPEGELFDVKVVRDPDGSCYLSTRQSQRLALAPFRVR